MPRVYNSVIVPAPIEQVWSRIRDFHDFSWAPSLVTSCEKVGEGDGFTIGARRRCNGIFLDTLIAYSEIDRRMMYSLDDGPSPVSSRDIAIISATCICCRLRPITSRLRNGQEYGNRKQRMPSST